MFWDSIVTALHVMTFKETYLLGAGYLIFLLVPISIISLAMKNRRCSGTGFKCVKILLLPVLQVIAVTTFTLVLSPVMLGMAEEASWRLPWKILSSDIALSFGLFGFLGLVAVGIVFIPVFGRLHSFRTLIFGIISLIFVQILISYVNPVMEMKISYMVPGFWFLTGVIAITGVLSKVDHYLSETVSAVLINKYEVKKGISEIVMFPLVSILGFIPVFIYAAWLA